MAKRVSACIGTEALTRIGDADSLIAAETERAFAVLVHLGPDGDAELPHAGIVLSAFFP